MSKLIRWTVTWLALPLALLAAGLYFLALPAAKFALSSAGGYASGVELEIEHLELDYRPWPLLTAAPARVRMSGVSLANPPGFEAPAFLTVQRVSVLLTPAALTRDPIPIAELALEGVTLNLERRDLISNAGLILTRLEAVAAGGAPLALGPRFAVERLRVEDGAAQIAYVQSLGPRGQRTVRLGERPHAPVTGAEQGLGTAALLYEVIDRVVSDALLQVAQEGESREALEARLAE